ncbi:MAG: hypothetical protein AAGE52_36780 [Myxococcota bacterium]
MPSMDIEAMLITLACTVGAIAALRVTIAVAERRARERTTAILKHHDDFTTPALHEGE